MEAETEESSQPNSGCLPDRRRARDFLIALAETVQGLGATQINASFRERGRAVTTFAKVVYRNHVPFLARPHDGYFPVFTRKIEPALGRNGRRRIPAQRSLDAACLQHRSRFRVEGRQDASVLDDVQGALVKKRRRHDSREALVVPP